MPQRDCDILLVEDAESDAELALRSLAKLAVHVHRSGDGESALDFLFRRGAFRERRAGPRVVFLDLDLPGIDGFDVLAAIRREDRTRELPVVVLSSSREEHDVEKSYRLGANSYVVKPVDFDRYGRTLQEIATYWTALNTAACAT